MKNTIYLLSFFITFFGFAQHDHHSDKKETGHNHLAHMQASRAETFYMHNLPPPKLMTGIGNSNMVIETKSKQTQLYFNQGLSLLHDFWDFEAYRAFKEAIRQDSTAVMPYWGLLQEPGSDEDSIYTHNKMIAIKQLKKLIKTANQHEKLYAEIAILKDSLKDKSNPEIVKKYEIIVHKFPDDTNAKLFLALKLMSGFDTDMNPMEGQMYSEFLLKDVQTIDPKNHAFHHYWIHLMEHCCPEQALKSADVLTSLAPNSGHIVHMPGHIYNRTGDYKRAHDAFVAAVKVDSIYMKKEGVEEVDNWNYIHNINYLISNCAHDGRHGEGLYYAEKLKNMPVTKERKKAYKATFFNQGILAPAKMEMAFGYWDKAAIQLETIEDADSIYGIPNIAYKDGLLFFVKGMDAISRKNVHDAINYSNKLDALLYQNTKQSEKNNRMHSMQEDNLNTASLELQGCIKSEEGNYVQAIKLLEKAEKNEKDLGYGEPPLYSRPIAMSKAAVYEKEGENEKAIECYNELLIRFPKSAYVYSAMGNNYNKSGNTKKAVEYEALLKVANKYGDKDIYVINLSK